MIDFETYSPLFKAHLAITLPEDRFYHYTSPDSLIGILKNKELWASNTLFLNDALEVKHGIQVAQDIIASMLLSETDSDARSFLAQMQRVLRLYMKIPALIRKKTYVISFTELEDALSQWRGYTPASGGYAVGFPPAQIKDMAEEQGFILAKCIYDVVAQKEILTEIINASILAFKKAVYEGDSHDAITTNSEDFFDYVLTVCSVMKHSSFDEEHEWRLISLSDKTDDQKLFFRSGNKGVIPYFKFKLQSDTHPNLIEAEGKKFVVRIGPSPNKEERGLAVSMMIKQGLNIDVDPVHSDVPYQTW